MHWATCLLNGKATKPRSDTIQATIVKPIVSKFAGVGSPAKCEFEDVYHGYRLEDGIESVMV